MHGYVEHYNKVCLNSVVGYITPKDMLAGRQTEIHAQRDRKLEGPKTVAGSSAEGRVKNDKHTFRVAGGVDNIRLADSGTGRPDRAGRGLAMPLALNPKVPRGRSKVRLHTCEIAVDYPLAITPSGTPALHCRVL